MDTMHLSETDRATWEKALWTGYERRIRVEVMTLDDDPIGSLTTQFVSGGVTGDTTSARSDDPNPTRMLDMTFVDPDNLLGLNTHVGRAQVGRNRKIRVHFLVRPPGWDEFVGPAVFTGVGWSTSSPTGVVEVVAQGMERTGLGEQLRVRHFPKGLKRSYVVQQLLSESIGFRNADVPWLKPTLAKPLTIGKTDKPWVHAVKLADSMDRQLFCNGYGRAIMRYQPTQPYIYIPPEAWVENTPTPSRTVDGHKNVVERLGPKPKGQKRRLSARAFLPPALDGSAWDYQQNGVLSFLLDTEEVPHAKRQKELERLVKRILATKAQLITDVNMACVPIPHLDELDRFTTDVAGMGRPSCLFRSWYLPLAPSGDASPMTISTRRWREQRVPAA